MCLNASLAGLVAITAPCDVTDALGAAIIGIVAGFLVVFGVWFLDNVLHIDDPVGAVAVHGFNGIWGTLAVGLFATTSAAGNDTIVGLFYGGGFSQLGIQIIGCAATAGWAAVTITIAFVVIKAIFGLRVTADEEIIGLDKTEHGLPSAYSGFAIQDITGHGMVENENTEHGNDEIVGDGVYAAATETQKDLAVPVSRTQQITFDEAGTPVYDTGMHKVSIITRLTNFDKLKSALNELGVTGMTVTQVMGCGVQHGSGEYYRGVEMDMTLQPKIKVEVIISSISVEDVIETTKKALYTGHIGDGKIFVYNVTNVVKVRTGEEDFDALKDVE